MEEVLLEELQVFKVQYLQKQKMEAKWTYYHKYYNELLLKSVSYSSVAADPQQFFKNTFDVVPSNHYSTTHTDCAASLLRDGHGD